MTICEYINTMTGHHWVSVPQLNFNQTYQWAYPQPLTEYSLIINEWTIPGKFGNLNVYSTDVTQECRGLGDIYAWNASDWSFETKFQNLIKTKEINIEDICGDITSLFVEFELNIDDILKLVKKLGGGEIVDVNLNKLTNQNIFLPYIETNGTQLFSNIYTNATVPKTAPWCDGNPTTTKLARRCLIYDYIFECIFANTCDHKRSSFLKVWSNSTLTLRYGIINYYNYQLILLLQRSL